MKKNSDLVKVLITRLIITQGSCPNYCSSACPFKIAGLSRRCIIRSDKERYEAAVAYFTQYWDKGEIVEVLI